MSDIIKLIIDGKQVEVPNGTTILQAAKKAHIEIPTLCFLKEINEIGDCRMCLVEVEGRKGFVTSCIQKAEEGMVVRTNTMALIEARSMVLDLILSNHQRDCLTCTRNGNCELQKLAEEFNVTGIKYTGKVQKHNIDDKSASIVRNFNKCILCRRCVATCKNVQQISAIDCINRGFDSCISTYGDSSLADVNCVLCGQCIESCPVGALTEKDSTEFVWKQLKDEDKYVVVQTAPAVRVALGEEFGMDIGTNVTGKMVTALKRLGFDKVFDTNTGADLTIMEEGTEFIQRIKDGGVLPMITSCSPGWINFCEKNYPEQLQHLSSCKSPQAMFGALIKSYFAEKYKIDPAKIVVVSVMPCVAKKYEITRKDMDGAGYNDVDAVITTRELARMIKQAHINFKSLEDSSFDDPMGEATGAGAIFGTTGGVMEAALRTVSEVVTGKELKKIEFNEIRGSAGIKEATINLDGKEIKIAVVSGLANARKIMDDIKAGKSKYSFIEIMACPGGCVMGGGQPIHNSKQRAEIDIRKLRSDALYSIDEKSIIRKSHENPVIQKLYKEYLEKPGSHKAHKLLHTTYEAREKYLNIK